MRRDMLLMRTSKIINTLERGSEYYFLNYKSIVSKEELFPIYNEVEARYAQKISLRIRTLLYCIDLSENTNEIQMLLESLQRICDFAEDKYRTLLREISSRI